MLTAWRGQTRKTYWFSVIRWRVELLFYGKENPRFFTAADEFRQKDDLLLQPGIFPILGAERLPDG
jgi:hypothetical protein